MDKAGYNKKNIDAIFLKNIVNNFNLTYNISTKEFDTKWKIYFPKGF